MPIPTGGRGGSHDLRPPWLADALDQAADMIFATDERDRFVYVNRKTIDLLGAPPSDLVGEMVIAVVAPDDHATILDALRAGRLADPPEAQLFGAAFLARHAEDPVHLEVALHPVISRRRVLGCVGVARNVSDRKAALDKRLASERVAAVAELANRAADRINNPLAVLVTHLRIIERAAADGSPADADPLEQMRGAVDRIAEVTKDLAIIADTSIQKAVLGRSIADLLGWTGEPPAEAEEPAEEE